VNVAGKPARIGGTVASALGWVVLACGLLATFALGGLAGLIFTSATALWVGGVVGGMTLLVSLPILFAGRSLRRSGEGRQLAAREQAVFALAAQHRGVLTARAAGAALAIPEADADALLTDLAKRQGSGVSLEVDDEGRLTYVFRDVVAATGRLRVPDQGWRVPEAAQGAAAKAPRIVDAELIDEGEAERADPARRLTR
jgi:membrane protein implicated in regulation of membrane protease activity